MMPTTPPALLPHQQRFLDDLLILARMVAGRDDLEVDLHAGFTWAFNLDRGRIRVPYDDLVNRPGAVCRAFILHEAAHARLTRLRELLTPLESQQLQHLDNVLEDCRIENWLERRFPAFRAWMKPVNDRFAGLIHAQLTREPAGTSRQELFLYIVWAEWWLGHALDIGHLDPLVQEVVDGTRTSCHEAMTACPDPFDTTPHTVATSQQRAWDAIRTGILPGWLRLAQADMQDGNILDDKPTGAELLLPVRARGLGTYVNAATDERSDASTWLRHLDHALDQPHGPRVWDRAWRQVGAYADRLADDLLVALSARVRHRVRRQHMQGRSVDLRRAILAEADPREEGCVWIRPCLPERPSPGLAVVIDRSSSMRDDPVQQAFAGLVLISEACARAGLPCAAWSFADDCTGDRALDQPLDDDLRRHLAGIPDRCEGGTAMGDALHAVGAAMADWPVQERICIVISDGIPNHPEGVDAAVHALSCQGIVCLGLGIGPETAGLRQHFRHCLAEVPLEQAAERLGDLVRRALTDV